MAGSKPPTPQEISRLLGTKYPKAVPKLRGGRSGFTLKGAEPGTVWVAHYFNLGSHRPVEHYREALNRYALVLTEAGYAVEVVDQGTRLIVTAGA